MASVKWSGTNSECCATLAVLWQGRGGCRIGELDGERGSKLTSWRCLQVPFLFLQVVLLHPAFPNSVSRPLRFLLTFPALWFSASFPFRYRIEPTHLAIGSVMLVYPLRAAL